MKTEAKVKVTMNCPTCDVRCASFGKHRNGLRRFRCGECGKTYTEAHEKPLGEMTLPIEKAILVLRMLLEGASIRSVERTTDVHRDTIMKLLVLAGEKCEKIMAEKIRNVVVRDLECDEVWSWIAKKQKRVCPEDDPSFGDCYVFTCIERTSKVILNVTMGKRDQRTTDAFIEGVRQATWRAANSKSQRTASLRIVPQSLRRCMTASLATRCSSRFIVRLRKAKRDILRLRFSPWRWSQSQVIVILTASALRSSNGAIFHSAWGFAASLA